MESMCVNSVYFEQDITKLTVPIVEDGKDLIKV